MSFKSLDTVLGGLQNQYQRQDHRQLQQIIRCWAEVVGPVVAAQTCPLNLYRGVLKVATSSAAWSQNLVFERQRILDKLNQVLALQITDIRFSPAQWQPNPKVAIAPGEQEQQELWHHHPSRLSDRVRQQPKVSPNLEHSNDGDAVSAFQQWARLMRSRSSELPLCPECHCPTPAGELSRWQVCAICITKRW